MIVLVLTKNKLLYARIAQLVAQSGSGEALVLQGTGYLEASLIVDKYSPVAIVIDIDTKGFDSFEFIRTFPASAKRHYALVPKRKNLAIKAIRHGVNGMFDFEHDENEFSIWLSEKRNLINSITSNKLTSN